MQKPQRVDRRIGKTDMALHVALMALVREKPYDEILVQEVLDRANVGRSTFYAHFRDKDELLTRGLVHLRPLLTGAAQKTRGTRASDRVTAFSQPMMEHAFEARYLYRSLVKSKAWGTIREHIADMLREIVREELNNHIRRKGPGLPPDVIVDFLIGTFLSLLSWWLDRKSPLSPAEANAIYLRLVLPALSAELEG